MNLTVDCVVYYLIIEKVELYLRTQLAYYSGHVHGALGYMDGAIYNDRHNHEKFVKLLNVCIEENKSTSVVQHHKEKYGGNFPIWVIVEFFQWECCLTFMQIYSLVTRNI